MSTGNLLKVKIWMCGDYELPIGQKTYLMGIVNVTPDSFSGDGALHKDAVAHARALMDAGADLVDIGGESTRPGAQPVSLKEELERVIPVVEALSGDGIPISVDTTKAEVARRAAEAGASIVNDISGGTFDQEMLSSLGRMSCGVILMHLREHFSRMKASESSMSRPVDVVTEVQEFWLRRIHAANWAGIGNERIALDAGFGFGKTAEENLELIRRGRELAALGFPTLSGTSRKSTIGKILNDAPVSERLFGTAATVALAIGNGAEIVRVHDVREMRDVARVADAVTRSSK